MVKEAAAEAGNPELVAAIREAIARGGGGIGFDEFMEIALYDEDRGYYAAGGESRIGRQGDYFTAVSVGGIYGALLAEQVLQVWREAARPEEFWVVEQGAGDAALAADILKALRQREGGRKWRYGIIEPLPRARQAQADRLEREGVREDVRWVSHPREWGPSPCGVFLANELVDSLPVRLVERCAGAWRERTVEWRGGRLVWGSRPADALVREEIRRRGLPEVEPYRTELHLRAANWIREAAGLFHRGIWLVADYGYPGAAYYAPERREGTLQTYWRHRMGGDPLVRVGDQDITAHVDFTRLAQDAQAAGLATLGFSDQHHFLVGIAADALAQGGLPGCLGPGTPAQRRAFATLMHPEMMGTRFHVLALAKGWRPRLDGFKFERPGAVVL